MNTPEQTPLNDVEGERVRDDVEDERGRGDDRCTCSADTVILPEYAETAAATIDVGCRGADELPPSVNLMTSTTDLQLSTQDEERIVQEVNPMDILGYSEENFMNIETEVATPQDDANSIVSSASAAEFPKPIGSKRRRANVLSDSDDGEYDSGISQRLRSRKTRIVEMTDNKDIPISCASNVSLPDPTSIASETDVSTFLESDLEAGAITEKKKKISKQAPTTKMENKKKKSSPIGDKLHRVIDTEQLHDLPMASLVTQALEWTEDIELIRAKSSFQGVISRYIKERLKMISACFKELHNMSLGVNDASRLKIRNARLAADYHAAQLEVTQLKQEIAKIKKNYHEEKVILTNKQRKVTRCISTSPIRAGNHNIETELTSKITEAIMEIKDRVIQLETSINKKDKKDKHEEFPELQPLPQRVPKSKPIIKSMETIDPEKRIIIKTKTKTKTNPNPNPNAEYLPCENLPSTSWGSTSSRPLSCDLENSSPGLPLESESRKSLSAAGDPRLVVPVPETERKEKIRFKHDEETDGYDGKDGSSNQWSTVVKRRRKKKTKTKSKTRNSDGDRTDSDVYSGKESGRNRKKTGTKSEKSAIQILQKKVPKASAVVIKGTSPDFSYAEALIKLRKEIPLEEIGISSTKIKRTTNGAVLIEIPGTDTKDLASKLQTRAADILGNDAVVSSPEVKGEIRIIGFDESVSASDISQALSKAGECRTSEVSVAPILPMRNGLCMTWVKCPIASALKASKAGKIPLGWTMARLELQKPRKMRCFKCWELGHHQGICKSKTDRTHACFRCGMDGHSAALCIKEIHCVLCESKGLSARHRIGSHLCGADPKANNMNEKEKLVRRPATDNHTHDANTSM